MPEWLQATAEWLGVMWATIRPFLAVLLPLVPAGLWCAYCLWCVNWKRMWATLAEGAWLPAVLLVVLVALVWSQIAPRSVSVFGIANLPNFWWQLLVIGSTAALGLFFGWLQGHYHLEPAEVSFDPPEHGHEHEHEHEYEHETPVAHGDGHHH